MAGTEKEQALPDEAFWKVADTLIASANEQASWIELSIVNAGFSYASSRYNAFVIASQCGSKEAIEAEKDAAIEHFVGQYKLALTENLADYQANFDKYIKK